LVYSYSKYFGATGWRLGVIALHQDNIFDDKLANLPEKDKKILHHRYESIALDPGSIKMIDRLVADSRAVALNHTSGLSTPQQIQMVLFSLSALFDTENNYKKEAKKIVRNRYNKITEDIGIKPLVSPDDPNGAFYYIEIDVLRIAESKYGKEFATWVSANYNPLDPVIRLAEEKAIIDSEKCMGCSLCSHVCTTVENTHCQGPFFFWEPLGNSFNCRRKVTRLPHGQTETGDGKSYPGTGKGMP